MSSKPVHFMKKFTIIEERSQNCLTKHIDPDDRGQLRLHKTVLSRLHAHQGTRRTNI